MRALVAADLPCTSKVGEVRVSLTAQQTGHSLPPVKGRDAGTAFDRDRHNTKTMDGCDDVPLVSSRSSYRPHSGETHV